VNADATISAEHGKFDANDIKHRHRECCYAVRVGAVKYIYIHPGHAKYRVTA